MIDNSEGLSKIIETKSSYLEDRSHLELWCNKYNHTFSLLRTIFGFMNILIAALIAFKVFGVI
jgi:hypothetical protein